MQSTLPNSEILDSIDSLYFVQCSSTNRLRALSRQANPFRRRCAREDTKVACSGISGG